MVPPCEDVSWMRSSDTILSKENKNLKSWCQFGLAVGALAVWTRRVLAVKAFGGVAIVGAIRLHGHRRDNGCPDDRGLGFTMEPPTQESNIDDEEDDGKEKCNLNGG
jgi:hypothetical protein